MKSYGALSTASIVLFLAGTSLQANSVTYSPARVTAASVNALSAISGGVASKAASSHGDSAAAGLVADSEDAPVLHVGAGGSAGSTITLDFPVKGARLFILSALAGSAGRTSHTFAVTAAPEVSRNFITDFNSSAVETGLVANPEPAYMIIPGLAGLLLLRRRYSSKA